MTARHQSAECFHSERFQKSASAKEKVFEDYVRSRGRSGPTRLDVKNATGADYSEVCARLNGLMAKGIVHEIGYVINESTGHRAARLIHRDNMPGMQGVMF